MTNEDIIDGWDDVVALFPVDFKEKAKALKVMKGARKDKDLLNTIRALFIHLGLGYSLKETAFRAKNAGLCCMSSVALFDRLRKFGPLFKEMCNSFLAENHSIINYYNERLRLIDATTIQETGKTGSTWRYHYSFTLPAMVCDFTKLTPAKGDGTGESLTNFPVEEGDLIIADRGYSHRRGVTYVKDNGGKVCIRLNHRSFRLYDIDGKAINLEQWLKNIKLVQAGVIVELDCFYKDYNTNKLESIRLCVMKKDDESIKKSFKTLKEREAKKQREYKKYNMKEDTIFLDQYILIVSTFPKEKFTAKKILEIYRCRWQIELVFKRFKSLLNLGHLPKTTTESAEAWLYGKLLIAFLIEKIIANNGAFSPWRDNIDGITKQSLAYFRFCVACYPAIDIADIRFTSIC